MQDRIDELVAQHGSLRAVARVTEIDAGYLSRLRTGEKVNPEKDKLRRLGLRTAWPGRFVPVSAYPRAWKPSHGASIGAVVCFMHTSVFEELASITNRLVIEL